MSNQMIIKGNPKIPNIALTFDDGPGRITPYILDVLRKYGAKATFFCLGNCIDKNIAAQDYTGKYITGSEVVKLANGEGHLIAIHSYDHLALTRLTDEEIFNNQLFRTKRIITNLIGNPPVYFRPPYGSINDRVKNIAKTLDLSTVLWSCRSADSSTQPVNTLDGPLIYRYSQEDIYKNIIKDVENGSIILCHDGHSGVHEANFGIISALDRAIPELQQKGFNFVTIDDLLAMVITKYRIKKKFPL